MQRLSLLGPAKAKVMQSLLSEGKTAGQVASQLHIQLSAARKHLERLEDQGLVTGTFESRGVGRPRKIYSLTTDGKELFPRQYDNLLNLVLTKIAKTQSDKRAESLLTTLAAEVASTLDGDDQRSSEHVKSVEEGVNQLGFAASFDRKGGRLTVISRNCPLWKVALTQRETICRGFHAKLLKDCFASEKVEREKWMVDGDAYCKHTIKV